MAALAVVVVVLTRGPDAPPDRAATLVPADALAYVHLATDRDRAVLEEFDAFAQLRARLFLDEHWLGDEAAFALTRTGELLVVLAVEHPEGAREFADAEGGEIVDGHVVLGERGEGPRLADLPAYRDVERENGRVLGAWLGEGAAERLLPARVADIVGGGQTAVDVTVTDEGLELRARRLGGGEEAADFTPRLLEAAPRDSFGYLSTHGLRSLGALVPEAAGASTPVVAGALGPLLRALDDEVAVVVSPGSVDTAVTLLAHAGDPAAAREALAGLQAVIAGALAGSEESTGQVPVFVERDLGDGLVAYALTLAGGGELIYAVDGDRVAISSDEAGVRDALRGEDQLSESGMFQAAVPAVPERVQALAFVAAEQLLELADEAGLGASAVYRAARRDLARVRALGAVVRRQGDDTTVELNLLIHD